MPTSFSRILIISFAPFIANNILKQIVNELIERKTTDIIIDWTNLMHIYRNYGFEIWKSYTYYEKKLIK